MKKVLFFLLLGAISLNTSAQKAVVDKDGNYHTATKPADKATGKTFTDEKGVVYPIYMNSKGKLYVIRKSKKTGKEYKSYLVI